MIKGIAHLAFDVADMEKSLHFTAIFLVSPVL